ncbi:MAG TPA: LysM peptidoglycan-binding domain-containing M23 family metallopeptidase [Caulobacteraceae bacterium]|nr:LysM peptidoglycan-binding domain-containing M23 family metallopeptidase [Caulobacteraceae bacterium]
MRNLWREAGIAALVCGSLTACASPAYPISEDRTAGSAPMRMARPAYPISEQAPPPRTVAPTPPPVTAPDDAESSGPPLAAPVSPVESQPLAPPGPSASNLDTVFSGEARLQYASLSTQSAPSAAGAPVSTTPTSAPVSTSLPPPAPTPAVDAAPAPATSAPAPAAEPALVPQMVVHDQPAPPSSGRPSPSVREAAATAPDRLLNAPAGGGVPGAVVDASGGIFENYEVQRGDHIDALARGFSTTPDVLIDANHIRAPYRIRPGQIMRVPVAKAYLARGGDTLTSVARRFSVGVDELAQLNHLSARALLRSGQEIGLPSSMRDRGAEYADSAPPTSSYMTPERPYRSYPPSSTVPVPSVETPPRYLPPSSSSALPQPATMSDSDIAQAAHGRFVWPVRGDMMARFGAQGVGRRNDGIDIRASQGTVVKAAASGEVVYAGNQVPGFGNLVLIKHADGWVTAYAHLDQVDVQMKQQVAQGQPLGSVGTSGGATEPELHFEVRFAPTPADKARPVDPVLVLPLG